MRSVVACARPCPGQARCVSPGSFPLQQAAHRQCADTALRPSERKAVLGTGFGHVGMLPVNLLFTFQLQNPSSVGLLTKQN